MATIVEQIRDALEKPDGISVELMSPLAEAYSEQVTRVNERLGDAVGLLRKGLRSEAIQLASLNPNAMDGAVELDFPEIGDWFEILQFLGVPVPPRIKHDAITQLNDAIVETQPLSELLSRHRRMAIAKAPLAWRLKVLRGIAHIDPLNAVWEEDIESWETARLKQIPAELTKAIKNHDVDAVAELEKELSANSWRVAPQQQLVKNVTSAAYRFNHEADTEQLSQIAMQLHEAFGQFDEHKSRQLRDTWREIQSRMKMPVAMELQDQVAPALAWLDERDAELSTADLRSSAIAILEQALDKGDSPNDLLREYQRASRFGEPIPAEIEQRYRVTIAEHQLRGRRKIQAVLTSIVATTILVGGWIGYRQWDSRQKQRIAEATTQLESLLDADKLNEAQQFLDQVRGTQPNVASASSIQSLASKLNEKIASDRERSEQIQGYLEKADNEDPSLIDSQALSKAESLAVLEKEKAAVFEIQQKKSRWEREVEAEHSRAILERLASNREALDRIESASENSGAISALESIVDEIAGLSTIYPRRSASASKQIELTQKRAEAMQAALKDRWQKSAAETEAFLRLVTSKSLTQFSKNLALYAKELPQNPVSKEFERVAKESALWTGVDTTNQFLSMLQSSIFGGITPKEATQILSSHQSVVNQVVVNPALESLESLDAVLEQIQNREMQLDAILEKMKLLVISDMVTMPVVKPENAGSKVRYFIHASTMDRDPKRFQGDGLIGVEIVSNASGAVKNTSFRRPIDFIDEPRATVRFLASQIQDRRQKFLSDWDTAFLELAAELTKRSQLDGWMKETLLFELMSSAGKGSQYLTTSLSDCLSLLKRRQEKQTRWFEPQPLSSELPPEVSSKVVQDLKQAHLNRLSPWRKIKAASDRRYEWIGFLARDKDGTITTQLRSKPTGPGMVCVARPAETQPSKVDIVKIGSMKNGRVELSQSNSDLIAGRPIFYLTQ